MAKRASPDFEIFRGSGSSWFWRRVGAELDREAALAIQRVLSPTRPLCLVSPGTDHTIMSGPFPTIRRAADDAMRTLWP